MTVADTVVAAVKPASSNTEEAKERMQSDWITGIPHLLKLEIYVLQLLKNGPNIIQLLHTLFLLSIRS